MINECKKAPSFIFDETEVSIDFEKIFSGKSTFTLVSKKTGKRLTLSLKRKEVDSFNHYVHDPVYWVYCMDTHPRTGGSYFFYIGYIKGYKGLLGYQSEVIDIEVKNLFSKKSKAEQSLLKFKDLFYFPSKPTHYTLGYNFESETIQSSNLKRLNQGIDMMRYLVINSANLDFCPDAYSDKMEIHHSNSCCYCGRKLTTPESVKLGIGPECFKLFEKKTSSYKN